MKTITVSVIAIVVVLVLLSSGLLNRDVDNTPICDRVTIPAPTGYVLDTTGTLTTTVTLESTIRGYVESGGSEIAVLLVNTTSPLTIDQYGLCVAEKWKVGDANADDGVIFVVATDDRQLRVEIGKGAEALITDGAAGRMVDANVVPYLKQNNWDGGVRAAVEGIIHELNN